jgi:hypothetical protein
VCCSLGERISVSTHFDQQPARSLCHQRLPNALQPALQSDCQASLANRSLCTPRPHRQSARIGQIT